MQLAQLRSAAAKSREILTGKELTETQVRELADVERLSGPLPPPSGARGGKPFWSRRRVEQWLDEAPRHRSSIAAAPAYGRAATPQTIDSESRTCEGVLASESRVPIVYRGQAVEEVLVVRGAEYPDRLTVFADHAHTTSAAIGTVEGIRSEGDRLVGTLRFARGDQRADSVWAKIETGVLSSLSVGYHRKAVAIIRAGESGSVAGKFYEAGEVDLHVVTRWNLFELSVVGIGADAECFIREMEINHQTRGQSMAPAIHSRSSITRRPNVGELVSAGLVKMGFTDPGQHRNALGLERQGRAARIACTPRLTMEAERGASYANEPWYQLIGRAAVLDGLTENFRDIAPVQNALYRSTSGGAVGQLFSELLGARFTRGYERVIDTTLLWTREADNVNFRPAPVTAAMPMESLKRRGRGETAQMVNVHYLDSETTQVLEYAAHCAIDERDLADDGGGILGDGTVDALGQAAARLRPDLVYSILLANPLMRDGVPLFHADHGNLQVSAAFSEENFAAARSLMCSQAVDGVPLDLRPSVLVVPTAQESAAAKILRDQTVPDIRSQRPPALVSDSRLDNGVTDPATGTAYAGDPTLWFVAADGTAGIEVQYLAAHGRDPSVNVYRLDNPGQFGLGFDVQHFIGAKAIDWRGLVKSAS